MDTRLAWQSTEGFQWNNQMRNFGLASSNQTVMNNNGAQHNNGADGYSGPDDAAYNNNQPSSDEHEPNEIEEDLDLDDDDDDEIDGSSCYLCTQCGKGFTKKRELEAHVLTIHENDDDEEEENIGSMQIESNDAVFDDADAGVDIKPSTFPHQYACKLCPRTFSVSSALNVHYTHTHKDKPQYDCELCGQAFLVKRELATHKRCHEGQPTHKCRQCGKEFGTKQLLRKHELWHTGERSHVCPQCGKAFFQKGHLTQHLMIHAGGRPHACVLCSKTFIFKFDLNRHMKIHAERIIVAATGGSPADANNGGGVGSPPSDMSFYSNPETTTTKFHDNNLSVADFNAFINSTTNNPLTPMFRRRNGRNFVSYNSHTAAVSPKSEFSENNVAASPSIGYNQHHHDVTTFLSDSKRVMQKMENSPRAVVDDQNLHEHQHDDSVEVSPANSVSSTTPSANSIVCCDQCSSYRSDLELSQRRVDDLKTLLVQRNQEIEALKSKVHHVGEVTGHLLETCSDFDKLWMLHSKKVYSQIQNVLNALD